MSLQSTLKCFALIACVAMTLCGDSKNPLDNVSLARFLAKSASAMQRNPARTISCSDYFLPAIECITHQFEESNKLCAETAAAARAAAEAETDEVQKELAQQADDSCGAIVECKKADGAQSKLKCYVDNGSEGSKGLRTLSNNANLKSSKFKEQLRRIDSQESVCITNGRLKYESDSAEAYDEFTSCIYGQTTVPSEPSHWCPESEEESGV